MKRTIVGLLLLALAAGCETRGDQLITTPISSATTLASLQITAGTLTPQFGAETTAYTASVQNTTTQMVVRAVPSISNATVTVNGAAVSAAGESAPIPLSVGANTISIVVRAQSGDTRTYTITVNRAGP